MTCPKSQWIRRQICARPPSPSGTEILGPRLRVCKYRKQRKPRGAASKRQAADGPDVRDRGAVWDTLELPLVNQGHSSCFRGAGMTQDLVTAFALMGVYGAVSPSAP